MYHLFGILRLIILGIIYPVYMLFTYLLTVLSCIFRGVIFCVTMVRKLVPFITGILATIILLNSYCPNETHSDSLACIKAGYSYCMNNGLTIRLWGGIILSFAISFIVVKMLFKPLMAMDGFFEHNTLRLYFVREAYKKCLHNSRLMILYGCLYDDSYGLMEEFKKTSNYYVNILLKEKGKEFVLNELSSYRHPSYYPEQTDDALDFYNIQNAIM